MIAVQELSTQPLVMGPLQSVQSQVQSQSQIQDTDLIIRVLVESKANTKLALDTLKYQYGLSLELHDLVAILKDHMSDLKAGMEVIATLELFNLMPQLHKTLVENLSNLEGTDAVNAYMKLMDLIIKQTSTTETTLNINDMRFKQAPRDLQRVYAQLEASGQLQQVLVIEHRRGEENTEDD